MTGSYEQTYQQQPNQETAAQNGPPPSNAGWAVAAVIFFWPLAFTAFNHALSVYPKWATGDVQGALHASNRAKSLGKIALWIAVGLFVLFVVFYAILFAALIGSANELSTR